MDRAREILRFWFGRTLPGPREIGERMAFWFDGADPVQASTDVLIRERFGDAVEGALRGEFDAWATTPHRRLALVLLLDQFPRNIHRGTSGAFAGDLRALALALEGLQLGADAALAPVERIFFYMPLQHSESLDAQLESVAAYRRLLAEAPTDLQPTFATCLDYAERHLAIIQRFGRFPHRNAVLGRVSTAEEAAWLTASGERFGQ
jgi:uncharacterized protein (DUF924 family)